MSTVMTPQQSHCNSPFIDITRSMTPGRWCGGVTALVALHFKLIPGIMMYVWPVWQMGRGEPWVHAVVVTYNIVSSVHSNVQLHPSASATECQALDQNAVLWSSPPAPHNDTKLKPHAPQPASIITFFFDQLKCPDSCFAHLMPFRCHISLTSYLRNARLYKLPKHEPLVMPNRLYRTVWLISLIF